MHVVIGVLPTLFDTRTRHDTRTGMFHPNRPRNMILTDTRHTFNIFHSEIFRASDNFDA